MSNVFLYHVIQSNPPLTVDAFVNADLRDLAPHALRPCLAPALLDAVHAARAAHQHEYGLSRAPLQQSSLSHTAALAGPLVLMCLDIGDMSMSLEARAAAVAKAALAQTPTSDCSSRVTVTQPVPPPTRGQGQCVRKIALTDGFAIIYAIEVQYCPILNDLRIGGKIILNNVPCTIYQLDMSDQPMQQLLQDHPEQICVFSLAPENIGAVRGAVPELELSRTIALLEINMARSGKPKIIEETTSGDSLNAGENNSGDPEDEAMFMISNWQPPRNEAQRTLLQPSRAARTPPAKQDEPDDENSHMLTFNTAPGPIITATAGAVQPRTRTLLVSQSAVSTAPSHSSAPADPSSTAAKRGRTEDALPLVRYGSIASIEDDVQVIVKSSGETRYRLIALLASDDAFHHGQQDLFQVDLGDAIVKMMLNNMSPTSFRTLKADPSRAEELEELLNDLYANLVALPQMYFRFHSTETTSWSGNGGRSLPLVVEVTHEPPKDFLEALCS